MTYDWICEYRRSRGGYVSITPIQLTVHRGTGWIAVTFVLLGLGIDATWRYGTVPPPVESLGRAE